MVVKIRLARFGKRHQPLYNIVVAQARTARDSKPMEVLGTYDPTPRIPLSRADGNPIDAPRQSQSDATAAGIPTPAQTSPTRQRQKRYKDLQLDTIRTKYWLGVGAQPSEPVWRLFSMMGLVDPKPGRTKNTSKA